MKIYEICSLIEDSVNYVKPIALKFSKENNIVEDCDIWANILSENGLDGGAHGVIHGIKVLKCQKK